MKDLPHKCFKCNYSTHTNIILSLHVRVHGRGMESGGDNNFLPSKKHDPIYSADISGVNTSEFSDIPMVWVSKPMGISKMFKCRFCPHVNMRKTNIQEHEKMHSSRPPQGNSDDNGPIQHHCPDCNYICNNAGVLSSHMKVHQAFFGQVCGVVDHKKSDEEQIEEMKKKVAEYEASIKPKIDDFEFKEEGGGSDCDSRDGLALHFCPVCPARFLFEKEINIHSRFHDLHLPFKCGSCSYTARQKAHLTAHLKVHTDEYQERTTALCGTYPVDKDYPKPKVVVILGAPSETGWNWKSESVWVVVKSEVEEEETKENEEKVKKKKKSIVCDKCPAEFMKEIALQYHKNLHGGPGPHKCRFCDYAVKTYGNLMRHEVVHTNESPTKSKTGEVPSSGTELYKQKTDANRGSPQKPIPAPNQTDPEFGSLIFGNPDFVYPTYMKNGRLREKRYKCHKCPSAFEKREQYKIHLSLHGSRQRYNCEKCDYSVKYFANYSQHMKKHSINETAKKQHGNEPIIEERDDEIPESPIVARCGKSLKTSVADQQAMMLMQTRNISNNLQRDSVNVDTISRCPYCPYANNRKDGVTSHIKCHSNTKGGAYTCRYCDYNVPQLHFLREHLKVHVSGIKFVKPEAYMKIDRLELWSEPVDPNNKRGKMLIFKDKGVGKKDRFLPPIEKPDFDSLKGRVYINLKTGEEEVEMDDEEEREKPVVTENGISDKMDVDEGDEEDEEGEDDGEEEDGGEEEEGGDEEEGGEEEEGGDEENGGEEEEGGEEENGGEGRQVEEEPQEGPEKQGDDKKPSVDPSIDGSEENSCDSSASSESSSRSAGSHSSSVTNTSQQD